MLERAPERVLVIAIGYLGDTVLTLPLVRAVRDRWPAAELAVWTRSRCADLFSLTSEVDRVLVDDAAPSDRTRDAARSWGRRGDLIGRLRRGRYDLVVDASGVPDTALVTWLAGGHASVGWSDQGLGSLYDRAVPYDVPGEHLHDRRRRLGRALGIELPAEPGSHVADRSTLPEPDPQTLGRVVLHLSAGWPAKEWPAVRFAELLLAARRGGHDPIVHAGPGDADALRATLRAVELLGGSPPEVVEGDASLFRLIARLRGAALLVAADCGPAHLAAALGTPTLTLFGPTDPALCRPLSTRARTLRAPNGRMASLAADEAWGVAATMLGGGMS